MDEKLQGLIHEVCSGFPTHDVNLSQVFDLRRFARMTHYAWKNNIGFHPEMFTEALKEADMFKNLNEDELESKAYELCCQADFAKSMFHAAFDIENLSL